MRSAAQILLYFIYIILSPALGSMFHGLILKKWACFLFFPFLQDKCTSSITWEIYSSGSVTYSGIRTVHHWWQNYSGSCLCIHLFKTVQWELVWKSFFGAWLICDGTQRKSKWMIRLDEERKNRYVEMRREERSEEWWRRGSCREKELSWGGRKRKPRWKAEGALTD